MKILFHLGHPAHFHLFKNVISNLIELDNEILILIKKKDILEALLKEVGYKYLNILPEGRKDNKLGIIIGMLKRDFRMFKICKKEKPNLLVGTSAEIGHIGKLIKVPSINFNEDDASVILTFAKLSYPFNDYILSPDVCNNLHWNNKTINYKSYHEFAYLHPNNFQSDKKIAAKYIDLNSKNFIIRFAQFNAHHDKGIKGIHTELAEKIISILKTKGNIYITSERELEPQFENYRINIKFSDIHHVIAYCSLYIGDSQTMAAEAGILGIPFIRFNDFVGRISYLNELENNYNLGFGYKTNEADKMLSKVQELITDSNLLNLWKKKLNKMLKEKIDTSSFFTWFIGNYPESVNIMKENPDYQSRFK